MHLRGEFFCRTTFTAPWGLAFPAREHAYFLFVEEGECWVAVEGDARRGDRLLASLATSPLNPHVAAGQSPATALVHLKCGDLLILPHGHPHAVSDHPDTPLVSLEAFDLGRGPLLCAGRKWGGGGASTRILRGAFHLERPEGHPLFRFMPASIHLGAAEARMHPGLAAMLTLMVDEAKAALPGVQGVITRLLETIFIQALRVWMLLPCTCGKEWLVALGDPSISGALDLIHRSPEQPWTVASLSEKVGLSRSPFAARFNEKVGMPPLAYLTQWRMRLAARLLREQNLSLTRVSGRVGYASEAAFSRAFKQQFGVSPGVYRRGGVQSST